MIFVALKNGRSAPIPSLTPQTTIEKCRYNDAEARKKARQASIANDKVKGQIKRAIQTPISHVQKMMKRSLERINQPINDLDEETIKLLAWNQPAKRGGKDDSTVFTPNLPSSLTSPRSIKKMSQTFAEQTSLIMPQDANTIQRTFGGRIIAMMEQTALVSASRHCQNHVLTASLGG